MTEPTCIELPDGTVEYRDNERRLHQVDGPAVIHPDGRTEWWVSGKLHRTDGPALIGHDGAEEWCLYGLLHREDGPAYTAPDGLTKFWYLRGVPHRVDGPARIWGDGQTQWWIDGERRHDLEDLIAAYEASVRTETADGSERWCDSRGLLHRVDGPAYTSPDGYEAWYLHGRYHRTDGPAASHPNGSQYWYLHGHLHRVDGPAITHPDGTAEWWIDGRRARDIEGAIAALAEETNDD